MARTGRPPKPIEQHAAEGTTSQVGRSRKAKPPTVPLVIAGRGPIEPPASLNADERKVFVELAEHVAAITDIADTTWIESAAILLLRARQARESIRKWGTTIEVEKTNRSGETYTDIATNPDVAIERHSLAAYRQWAEQLGIGPAARARLAGLAVEGRDVADEMDELSEDAEREAAGLKLVKGGKQP